MRLSRETFNSIRVSLAEDQALEKHKTNFRKPYPVEQRLGTVLYYCGQGLGFSALETATGVSDSLISELVPDVTMVSTIHTIFLSVNSLHHLQVSTCCVQNGKACL
jgi:hypothetical protein